MTDREVMQQALDALENTAPFVRAAKGVQTAMAALRAAFAAPQDEPVAWIEHGLIEAPDALVWERGTVGHYTPLCVAPPKRKPLLDSDIVTMYAECPRSDAEMIEFAREIERAHGIGGGE